MNEQIKKLCAELLHYDDMIFGWEDTVNRAAEAIVRECCNVVDAQNYYVYSGDVKKLILERFGVAE
jgi:hypothetical protein